MAKMTKRDIAGYLGVDVQTLRNWKKTRPNLYRVIMQGLLIDEVVAQSKENHEKLVKAANKNKDD
jgi:hypothetical protein